MNTSQLAHAFVTGCDEGRCHNALLVPDPDPVPPFQTVHYRLQGEDIATAQTDVQGNIHIAASWRGHYTQAAAMHLNRIIEACRSNGLVPLVSRVSAAAARSAARRSGQTPSFIIV